MRMSASGVLSLLAGPGWIGLCPDASRVPCDALRGRLRPERARAQQRRRPARRATTPRTSTARSSRISGWSTSRSRASSPAVPLPSPASGFTYKFDSGTPARSCNRRAASARSWPIAPRRSARGRIAFGFTSQFFSFDHLDGVSLTASRRCSGTTASRPAAGRADVVSTANTIQAGVSQFAGALTYGVTDRIDVSLAVPLVRTHLSLLSNAQIIRLGTGSNVQVHYFRDELALGGYGSTHQFFVEGTAGGIGDLVVRVKAHADARRRARLRGRSGHPAADRRRAEPARLRGDRAAAVRGVLVVLRRVCPPRQPRLPLERRQRARRRRPQQHQVALPDLFKYAAAPTSASTTASASSSTSSASASSTRLGCRLPP